ncbi:hypothetical protein GF351_01200 [Candidatus Woesearchaeota archaeon]|nr:hypothetical protein [Candidatus Woesearchaeota archaeon]
MKKGIIFLILIVLFLASLEGALGQSPGVFTYRECDDDKSNMASHYYFKKLVDGSDKCYHTPFCGYVYRSSDNQEYNDPDNYFRDYDQTPPVCNSVARKKCTELNYNEGAGYDGGGWGIGHPMGTGVGNADNWGTGNLSYNWDLAFSSISGSTICSGGNCCCGDDTDDCGAVEGFTGNNYGDEPKGYTSGAFLCADGGGPYDSSSSYNVVGSYSSYHDYPFDPNNRALTFMEDPKEHDPSGQSTTQTGVGSWERDWKWYYSSEGIGDIIYVPCGDYEGVSVQYRNPGEDEPIKRSGWLFCTSSQNIAGGFTFEGVQQNLPELEAPVWYTGPNYLEGGVGHGYFCANNTGHENYPGFRNIYECAGTQDYKSYDDKDGQENSFDVGGTIIHAGTVGGVISHVGDHVMHEGKKYYCTTYFRWTPDLDIIDDPDTDPTDPDVGSFGSPQQGDNYLGIAMDDTPDSQGLTCTANGGTWTGEYCCGEEEPDFFGDNTVEGDDFDEYYNDPSQENQEKTFEDGADHSACWNSVPQKENRVVNSDTNNPLTRLFVADGKIVSCGETLYTDYTDSHTGTALVTPEEECKVHGSDSDKYYFCSADGAWKTSTDAKNRTVLKEISWLADGTWSQGQTLVDLFAPSGFTISRVDAFDQTDDGDWFAFKNKDDGTTEFWYYYEGEYNHASDIWTWAADTDTSFSNPYGAYTLDAAYWSDTGGQPYLRILSNTGSMSSWYWDMGSQIRGTYQGDPEPVLWSEDFTEAGVYPGDLPPGIGAATKDGPLTTYFYSGDDVWIMQEDGSGNKDVEGPLIVEDEYLKDADAVSFTEQMFGTGRWVSKDREYWTFQPAAGSESECCNLGHCWNGIECVEPANDIGDSGSAIYQDGLYYRCILQGTGSDAEAVWEVQSPKWSWDYSGYGFCPSENQCLVDEDESADTGGDFSPNDDNIDMCDRQNMKTMCVNDSLYVGDHYCENGRWTTRTKLLALQMLEAADAADNDYALHCGDYWDVFNKYDYGIGGEEAELFLSDTSCSGVSMFDRQLTCEGSTAIPCVNGFCVLRYGNGEKIMLGASMNSRSDYAGQHNLLAALGYDEAECDDAIVDTIVQGGEQFYKCSDSSSLWYNHKLRLLIYARDGESVEGISFFDSFVELMLNPIDEIFDLITEVIQPTAGIGTASELLDFDLLRGTKDFDRIYMAKKEDKLIYGVWEKARDPADPEKQPAHFIVADYDLGADSPTFVCQTASTYNQYINLELEGDRLAGYQLIACNETELGKFTVETRGPPGEAPWWFSWSPEDGEGTDQWRAMTSKLRLVFP